MTTMLFNTPCETSSFGGNHRPKSGRTKNNEGQDAQNNSTTLLQCQIGSLQNKGKM